MHGPPKPRPSVTFDLRQEPRCGKAARRDLCGGTGVTRPPTATAGPRLPTVRCGKINSSNRSRLSSVGISRQHARFAIFAPQKAERVSNQALGPKFSNSNTLPVEPTWKKTRNE